VINGQPVRRAVISIDSEKTGMRVELPPLPQVEATLNAGPTGGPRGPQGRSDLGCREWATERELDAIFGWSGGRMATLYTKSANRTRLAAGAIGELDRGETENRTSIPAPSAEVRAGNRKSE
jgi:hypothetical protein